MENFLNKRCTVSLVGSLKVYEGILRKLDHHPFAYALDTPQGPVFFLAQAVHAIY